MTFSSTGVSLAHQEVDKAGSPEEQMNFGLPVFTPSCFTLRISASDSTERAAGRQPATATVPRDRSVAVVVGLVRTLDRNAEILGLLLGERLELHAQLAEV
jgi:hypothetical protein